MATQTLPGLSNSGTPAATVARSAAVIRADAARIAQVGPADPFDDRVALSPRSRSLASLPPVIEPTPAAVSALADDLGARLRHAFERAGLPPSPAVDFTVDERDGAIRIEGERPDAMRIAQLLEGEPALARDLRDLAAVASHAHALEQHAPFRRDDRHAMDGAGAMARYGRRFSGQLPVVPVGLRLAGDGFNVLADGQPWPKPPAPETAH